MSTNAQACRGEGRTMSAMSGSSASARRTAVSVSSDAAATNAGETGSVGTPSRIASTAVRAV